MSGGFFFKAIQRAVGTVPAEVEVEPDQEVNHPVAALKPASTAPLAESVSVATAASPAPTPRLRLGSKVEKLVTAGTSELMSQNLQAAEEWRVIRTRMIGLIGARKIRKLLITSAGPSEGKTLTSANLGFVLAQLEHKRVLLVDCDLRKPGLATAFDVMPEKGLGEFLENKCSIPDILLQARVGLDVILSRTIPEATAELLQSRRMHELLDWAGAHYDLVLLDSPPLLPVADAQVLSHMVDGAILVVRADRTDYELVGQCVATLQGRLVGTILNGVSHLKHRKYYHKYGYGYGLKAKQ